MSSHLMEEVFEICSYVSILVRGKVIKKGKVDDVLGNVMNFKEIMIRFKEIPEQ